MRYALILAVLTVPLMAAKCSTDSPIVPQVVCAHFRQYSKETQAKALAELDRIVPQAPTIVAMLGDYKSLRDALRVCLASRSP